VVDSIADAIAGQEAISALSPSAVIAGPSVVAAIRMTKASTSGTYVLDPTAAGPSSIFGVPVISTPATSATVVWVVEASGMVIYRRGGLAVDIGTNADGFQRNVQMARAEERMATAVMRPTALTKITLS
jgi:HK97 family phage major capsid protein